MALAKFVDSLPVPSVVEPTTINGGIPFYEITMKQFKQKLHRDLPETTVWGYNGVYPGPTFEVRSNHPIKVKWMNDLPVDRHLLPVDTSVHGAQPPNPTVRTVVHLHGANVPPESDGYPEAWFTNGFSETGPFLPRRFMITPIYSRQQRFGIMTMPLV